MQKKIMWTTIYILYIFWIFSNSLDVADVSSEKSTAVLQFLNGLLFGGYPRLTEHIVRKLAHFSEYALAGLLGGVCILPGKKVRFLWLVVALAAGLLVALCDETIQLFVPGRSGQVLDVWIDFAGYAVGICTWLITRWIWCKMHPPTLG